MSCCMQCFWVLTCGYGRIFGGYLIMTQIIAMNSRKHKKNKMAYVILIPLISPRPMVRVSFAIGLMPDFSDPPFIIIFLFMPLYANNFFFALNYLSAACKSKDSITMGARKHFLLKFKKCRRNFFTYHIFSIYLLFTIGAHSHNSYSSPQNQSNSLFINDFISTVVMTP